MSNTADIGSGTAVRSLCQNPATIHCVNVQPPRVPSEAIGPPVRPKKVRGGPASPPMASLTASRLMLTDVRSPAVSVQEILKSQIVARPPSEQGIPPGLLASPANAGVKGRVKGTVSVKLSPV